MHPEQPLNPENSQMQPHRNPAVDLIRALALIGIAIVNLPVMALPFDAMLSLPEAAPDRAAVLLVEWLFQAKVFLLFSFIFGWGMEIQSRSAERAGASFARRFARRLAMLAIFGILHAILVFAGDILLLYALLGLLAWAARGASPRTLLACAAALIPVAVLSIATLAISLEDVPVPPATPSLGGSYVDTVLARLRDWPQIFVFLLLFQGPLALAAFLCGMAAARSGFFDTGNPAATRLQRVAPALLVAGLAVNALYILGDLLVDRAPVAALLAFCSLALGGPLLATAYLGLILRHARQIRLPEFMVLAGRNSLSSYVLQGILAGLLFGGYGLGLFGQIGQLALLPLALAIALASMALVAASARASGHAPLERLLRRVTYG